VVDDALVGAAVQEINRLYVQKGLETAREIGECLVRTFFGGDAEVFDAREAGHASFRALADHEDLRVSHSFLWYAVRLLPQLRALPETVAVALPLSHHRLLLHVKDEGQRARLAERAVSKDLSREQLAEEIRKLREKERVGAARGRKPLPGFVRAFNRLQKVAQELDGDTLDEGAVLNYGIDEARQYLDQVESMLAQLGVVRGQLAARVAALGTNG
jgi:hypothetical protein